MNPLSIAAIGWLLGSLVTKAVTELLEAWANRIGLRDEFKTLKDQLLQLEALLTSAHNLRTNNRFLNELVQDLQQLAYQAENLLDELDYYRLEDQIQQRGIHEKENCSNKSLGASSSSGHLLACHPIISTLEGLYIHSAPYAPVTLPETSHSIINLSRRMNELAEQLQKYVEQVRNAVKTESLVIIANNTEISQTKAINLHQTSSFLTEPSVFGRDQERDQLMNQLTNEESAIVGKVPVLAIVGTGGVGKTTLARLVFNDPKVDSYFKVRLWICVSTRFDIVRLTHEMLEGVCGNRYREIRNLNELQNKLKDKLESKRFLLVLDDMWEDKDKSQWDSMVAPLNYCTENGGIILVTTRNQSVAKMINAKDISLHGLEKDEFLSFFSTCIFNDPNYGGNSRLRKIGQEIANKLKGNPLAAKTVSALLKENLDGRYWMKIRDSEEWKFQSGPNDIMPALRLSYEHMPFHLQRCFSYCAIFPEDHPFTYNELVYLWMAQGFLDVRSEAKRMEDIGRVYFDDMFNRGFFQTIQRTYDKEAYYTFHDLIHDLAHMVAFKECLTINGRKPTQIPPTIRHLSIFNSLAIGEDELEEHLAIEEPIVRPLACLEGKNLSTLLIEWNYFCEADFPLGIFRNISDLLKETRFLRAVRISSQVETHNFNYPNFVGLRYLRLIIVNDTYKILPREICRLYHLQVLEIEGGLFLNELPNNFSDLVSLRHFNDDMDNKLNSMISGVGKLTSLQELNYFDVQQKKGFEIEQLGSLKEIGGQLNISNLENVKSKAEANKARLAEKEKLDALYLNWNHGEQENASVLEGLKPNTNLKWLEIHGYGGVASPTWLDPSLIFLESLTLEDCKAWELLPPIGDLEFLKCLKLSGLAVREIGPQCYGPRQSMKFPSLKKLVITNMPDLEKWVWSDQLQLSHCFQNLHELTIRNCTKLVDFTLSGCDTSELLERFPNLERLIFEDCPLICKLPVPLPLFPLFSFISIKRTGFVESMYYNSKSYVGEGQKCSLKLDKCSSLKVGELLAFQELRPLISLEMSHISSLESLDLHSFVALEKLVIEGCQSLTSITFGEHLENVVIKECQLLASLTFGELSSLRFLNIYHISSLESLDLHYFVAIEKLVIEECQSLTSLTFGEHLVSLWVLEIVSCKALSSMKGLKSLVNLKWLYFRECPGFIAAWDSASKEIEKTEPEFSMSLPTINGDSLSLLTLPICKQLTSLQCFHLEVSAFTEDHEVSLQLLASIDLVDIRGCKNLQSFPFDLFPSLESLSIYFPHIQSLPESSHTEITEEYKKIRNIKEVYIFTFPVLQIKIQVSSEEMICQQMDADN